MKDVYSPECGLSIDSNYTNRNAIVGWLYDSECVVPIIRLGPNDDLPREGHHSEMSMYFRLAIGRRSTASINVHWKHIKGARK